jgi:hypothetical protein
VPEQAHLEVLRPEMRPVVSPAPCEPSVREEPYVPLEPAPSGPPRDPPPGPPLLPLGMPATILPPLPCSSSLDLRAGKRVRVGG